MKMMDPDKRLELVQQLEAKLEDLRANLTESVTVGGGAVTVEVDRTAPVRSVRLDAELCADLDAEEIGDLVASAVNTAAARLEERFMAEGFEAATEMKRALGGGFIRPPMPDPVG